MLFDDVLEEIGEGIFQRYAIAVAGIAVLAESLATSSIPFVAALVSCDLDLSMGQVVGLSAIIVIGMIVGGYWLGTIADVSGRKYILSTTSIITFISCFVASFSQCVIMLFVSLFFLGIGVGGNHITTRVYIIEIIPKSCRGSRYMILEIFYALGYISAIGIVRLLAPPDNHIKKMHFVRLNSWRVLFGLAGSLSIFSACLMSVFPASPRWLLAKRQEPEAVDILRKLYAINKVKHEESFPNVQLNEILHIEVPMDDLNQQCNGHFWKTLRSIRTFTKTLFSSKFVKRTIVAMIINALFFDGFVLTNIWFGITSLTFNSSNCILYGGSPAIVRNASNYCTFEFVESLFQVNFYYSFSSLSVVFLMIVIDKVPRKTILIFSGIMAGVCCICFAFAPYEDLLTSMAFLTLSFSFAFESSLRLVLLESYPTTLRGTAYGLIKIFSKSLLVFLIILQRPCIWSYLVFGGLFIVAGGLSFLTKSFTREPLVD